MPRARRKKKPDPISEKQIENLRKQIFQDYTSLVTYIAHQISARIPSVLDVSDLISAGYIGLMDAIERFDPERDNKFKTYAEHRIRGAMIDELRSLDSLPRSLRDQLKKIKREAAKMEQELGRSVSIDEVAAQMNVDVEKVHQLRTTPSLTDTAELSERVMVADSDESNIFADPLQSLENKEMRLQIKEIIEQLPDQYRMVLSLYYYDGCSLREIAQTLSLTESRVSQIHQHAIKAIKKKMRNQ